MFFAENQIYYLNSLKRKLIKATQISLDLGNQKAVLRDIHGFQNITFSW